MKQCFLIAIGEMGVDVLSFAIQFLETFSQGY